MGVSRALPPLSAEMAFLGAYVWVDLTTASKRRRGRLVNGMDEYMDGLVNRPTFAIRVVEAIPHNEEARAEAAARWDIIRKALLRDPDI